MSIILSADRDPTCHAIATFLAEQLSNLSATEIEIGTVLDYDGMVGGAALNFPLLQVYRLGSKGTYLETSTFNIDYYLYSAAAYAERPGILRLVEVAIAHLLQDKLPYHGLSELVRLRVEGSDRGFLKLDSGEIFPHTRMTLQVQEINVTSPL